jgi:hypothetical protein
MDRSGWHVAQEYSITQPSWSVTTRDKQAVTSSATLQLFANVSRHYGHQGVLWQLKDEEEGQGTP